MYFSELVSWQNVVVLRRKCFPSFGKSWILRLNIQKIEEDSESFILVYMVGKSGNRGARFWKIRFPRSKSFPNYAGDKWQMCLTCGWILLWKGLGRWSGRSEAAGGGRRWARLAGEGRTWDWEPDGSLTGRCNFSLKVIEHMGKNFVLETKRVCWFVITFIVIFHRWWFQWTWGHRPIGWAPPCWGWGQPTLATAQAPPDFLLNMGHISNTRRSLILKKCIWKYKCISSGSLPDC